MEDLKGDKKDMQKKFQQNIISQTSREWSQELGWPTLSKMKKRKSKIHQQKCTLQSQLLKVTGEDKTLSVSETKGSYWLVEKENKGILEGVGIAYSL